MNKTDNSIREEASAIADNIGVWTTPNELRDTIINFALTSPAVAQHYQEKFEKVPECFTKNELLRAKIRTSLFTLRQDEQNLEPYVDLILEDFHQTGHKAQHYMSKSEWISVEEKLPEEEGVIVLGFFPKNNMGGNVVYRSGSGFTNYNPNLFGEITHWMPLPQPPSKGVGTVLEKQVNPQPNYSDVTLKKEGTSDKGEGEV